MKTNKILFALAFTVLSLFTINIFAQNEPSKVTDSTTTMRDEITKQQVADKDRLNNAKDAKMETRSDAKVTQQVNRDAQSASTEAKKAYRDEKQAQKSRVNADKQAKKASDAREKSDNN